MFAGASASRASGWAIRTPRTTCSRCSRRVCWVGWRLPAIRRRASELRGQPASYVRPSYKDYAGDGLLQGGQDALRARAPAVSRCPRMRPCSRRWNRDLLHGDDARCRENALIDTIYSLGLMICFYKKLAAFACVWYFRRELFWSFKGFVLEALLPGLGGIMLALVFLEDGHRRMGPCLRRRRGDLRGRHRLRHQDPDPALGRRADVRLAEPGSGTLRRGDPQARHTRTQYRRIKMDEALKRAATGSPADVVGHLLDAAERRGVPASHCRPTPGEERVDESVGASRPSS